MSGILPLQFRPTPNVGTVFDPTVNINAAAQALQLKQQQEQHERQNALMGIFRDPKSLDGTGNPTPETMQKIMSVDPQVGMTVRQNMMIGQERKLRTEALSSDLMAKKMDMIGETAAPIMETYETEVKNGVPEEQARRNAQASLVQANERLKTSGIFNEEDAKRFPTQFDPIQMRNVVAGTKQYQENLKQKRADTEEARKQKHDEDVNYNKGTSLTQDNQGNPVTYRPNAPPGQQFVGQDGKPVPPERMTGLTKVGAGAGSAATQDRKAQENVAKVDYEKELGRPVNMGDPAEKAELDRRVLAAEDKRKADVAASGAAAKQAATAKGTDVVVDGQKHQQAIWKFGQWFEPDGVTPIKGQVQMAGTARADQTLADREKHAKEVEDAGVPDTPQQKAATAAQVATGEPMTQIIPGWGPASRKAQREARADAVQMIMDQTGMDATDAGIELANRGIEYSSGKKAQGIQQTMLSTTRTAVKQLDYNIDKVKEELVKLKSTNISPVVNAILRKEEEWTGDPNLSSLFYSMSAVGMESARILSGGSASIQQLHEGAANEARKWANIGMTPASFEAVARTISEEGKARLKAWEDGIKEGRIGGQPKTGNTAPPPGQQGAAPGAPQQQASPVQIPAPLAPFDKAGTLAHNADGTVFYNTETKKYYDKAGKETAAPGAAQPAQPATPARPETKPIPLRQGMKETDLEDGKVYETPRGVATWNSATKRFTPIKGP